MNKQIINTAQFLLKQGVITSSSLLKDAIKTLNTNNTPHKSGGARGAAFWKKITFLAAFPSVLIIAIATYIQHDSHEERPEFIPYDYLRIRNKRFPWGDGVKSFFHNSKVNPLPDGYEDDEEE